MILYWGNLSAKEKIQMKYCRHCANPMDDNEKICPKCGADFAGRTGKRYKKGSGVSKALIFITALSVITAIAVIIIFAVIPNLSKTQPEEIPPIEEIENTDISELSEALDIYTLFLNGKLDSSDLSKLIPLHLSDYLCSLYNFSPAEVLEAGYEKTASVFCRQHLSNCKDGDIYVALEIKDSMECEEAAVKMLDEYILKNFRTETGSISKAYLLNVDFKYCANENTSSESFALTNYGETLPVYAILLKGSWYITDTCGNLAFDEWDIHSYYSEYYMHN